MELQPAEILASVINALTGHIAVLDARGRIVAVNQSWKRFARENGLQHASFLVGADYLDACAAAAGDETAAAALRGIRAVLAGEQDAFSLEYPCHAPRQERWFIMHATRAAVPEGGAVVCHDDITARKLAEKQLGAAHAALEAAHADLERALARERALSRTDPLTGASNRRHFFDLAAQELEVSRRYGEPLSVVLFDVDHFKRVNDTWGHQAGDETLRTVAALAVRHLRDADVLARYGGEEFIALLPRTDAEGALAAAERIRADVAAAELPGGAGGPRLTISCGVAVLAPEDQSVDHLVRRADHALYAAKRAGRNQSLLADAVPAASCGTQAG